MWENSSAYSRVRFEDIATITSKNTQNQTKKVLNKHLNINKHLKIQSQLTPTSTKTPTKSQLQYHRKVNTLPNGNPTVTTLGSATHSSSDFTV